MTGPRAPWVMPWWVKFTLVMVAVTVAAFGLDRLLSAHG